MSSFFVYIGKKDCLIYNYLLNILSLNIIITFDYNLAPSLARRAEGLTNGDNEGT